MTLSKALEGFTLWLACQDISENTRQVYHVYLKLFASYAGADTHLVDITPAKMREFWSWFCGEYRPHVFPGQVPKEHPSQSTRNNCWSALAKFWGWADAELDAGRPDKAIPAVKRTAESSVQPFTQDEVSKLLASAEKTRVEAAGRSPYFVRRRQGERDTTIILVMLDTGVRVSELCRLRMCDYNTLTGEIAIAPYGTAKKSHGRVVFLGKRTRQVLWKYLSGRDDNRPEDPIFLDDTGRQMSRKVVAEMLAHLGQITGIQHCHPHRFRHTFAIQFLRNGGNIFVLQRILGHRDLAMCKRYLQLSDQDTQTAMANCSPADRWRI